MPKMALGSQEGSEPKPAEGGGDEGKQQDTGVPKDHPVFGEESGGSGEGDGDNADSIFRQDGQARKSKGRVEKRIAKLVHERETEASERRKLAKKTQKLQEVVDAYGTRYAANPDLLKYDHNFMSKLEEMTKNDPALAVQVKKVIKAIGEGDIQTVTTPKNDPASDDDGGKQTEDTSKAKKLASQVASRALKDVGFKPYFAKQIADHAVEQFGAAVDEMSEEDVISVARDYCSDNELTAGDVLVGKIKPKSDDGEGEGKTSKRPPTGQQSQASSKDNEGGDEGEGGKDPNHPQYKNIEELEAGRKKRIREGVRRMELGGE